VTALLIVVTIVPTRETNLLSSSRGIAGNIPSEIQQWQTRYIYRGIIALLADQPPDTPILIVLFFSTVALMRKRCIKCSSLSSCETHPSTHQRIATYTNSRERIFFFYLVHFTLGSLKERPV